MELNAEQIMKALKVCGEYTHGTTCNSCPYMHIELADNEICSNRLSQDALALIKQLAEENERLSVPTYMLREDGGVELMPTIKSIRADTVREMQERLEKCFDNDTAYKTNTYYENEIWVKIDQIAKEMLEDNQ